MPPETDLHKSALSDHALQTNHIIDWDSAKLLQRESDWYVRGIKESICIRQHPKNINRDENNIFIRINGRLLRDHFHLEI